LRIGGIDRGRDEAEGNDGGDGEKEHEPLEARRSP
jgi:hypothetical protein